MIDATQQFHAILFADVAGSTGLYERHGDQAARAIITGLLSRMAGIAARHSGVLVKTIGDEILCRFPTAERAVSAAIAMQENLAAGTGDGEPRKMRMGLHWGPVMLESGDVFGDAVNVAARMSAIARAGQIVTTRDTVATLPEDLAAKTRLFDTALLKGRQDSLEIHEVLWEKSANATVFTAAAAGPTDSVARLELRYRDQTLQVQPGSPVSIGRAESCDLVVSSPLASRHHARIETRRGKFVFIDQSTNGSYVRSEDGNVVYLRREELPLWGEGIISLGEPAGEDTTHFLYYHL
jgi:class 3 adenylate cyclase